MFEYAIKKVTLGLPFEIDKKFVENCYSSEIK